MKPLKLGFIGGGVNSAVGRAHYAACRMDGLFEVVTGCFSRDKHANEETGRTFDCCATSLGGVAVYADLDAVVVLTPTPHHADDVELALNFDIPVICEKALAATPEQTAQLCVQRERTNGFLTVTYNYTGYPMIRELREIIQADGLGRIISVHAEMPQEGYLRTEAHPQDWRLKDGIIPGVHLDLGTHLHHLIHFLTNDVPIRLVAQQSCHGNFGVIDDVNCLAEYASGFTAALWFGKASLGHRNGLRVRVCGTAGSAEWVQSSPEEMMLSYANGGRATLDRASPGLHIANDSRYQRFKAGHPAGFIEAYASLYSDIAVWLRGHLGENVGETTVPAALYSPEIAHQGLVMMAAMVDSANRKEWVPV